MRRADIFLTAVYRKKGKRMIKLETERLFLREMTPNDFDALYAVLADSDIMQHYPYPSIMRVYKAG